MVIVFWLHSGCKKICTSNIQTFNDSNHCDISLWYFVVLFPDEKTTSLCCWDSRNADRQRLLSLGKSFVHGSLVGQTGKIRENNLL